MCLFKKPICKSLKDRAPDISILMAIRDVILILEFLTRMVLTGESSDVSVYYSILVMMPAQILTG